MNDRYLELAKRIGMGDSERIPKLPLNPGTYSLTVTIFDERKGEILKRFHAVKDIQVVGSHMGFSSVQLQGEWEFV